MLTILLVAAAISAVFIVWDIRMGIAIWQFLVYFYEIEELFPAFKAYVRNEIYLDDDIVLVYRKTLWYDRIKFKSSKEAEEAFNALTNKALRAYDRMGFAAVYDYEISYQRSIILERHAEIKELASRLD